MSLKGKLDRLEKSMGGAGDGYWEPQRIMVPDPPGATPTPVQYVWRRRGAPKLVIPDYDERWENPDGTPRTDLPDDAEGNTP